MTNRFVPVLLFLVCLPAAGLAVEAGPRIPPLLDLAIVAAPASARVMERFTLELEVRTGLFPAGSVAVELRGGAFEQGPAPPVFSLPEKSVKRLKLSARARRGGLHPLTVRITCDPPAEGLAKFTDDPKFSPVERERLRGSVAALRALGRPAFARSVTLDVR